MSKNGWAWRPSAWETLAARSTYRLPRRWILAVVALSLLANGIVSADQEAPLPPFVLDPHLPAGLVDNHGQGLGQCHWLDTQTLADPHISWAYDASAANSAWDVLEPQPGSFNWEPLDRQVAKAKGLGKHIWLELLTTEGHTPQWALDAGVVQIGSRGGTPLPWNATYQQLLRRAVHSMAARYDDDPTVDAIVLMAGGCYGEMSICAPQADRSAWEAAGYNDEAFVEAAKQLIDIYLEDEHVWEDGSRSRGFLKTPVVLQLGSGLYGHTRTVMEPVVDYALEKYGLRVWLKYNGWGGTQDMGWLYERTSASTRVGYEPAGNTDDFLARPQDFVQTALAQHASFLCLQKAYLDITNPAWQEARELAARHLGAQIVYLGAEMPASVTAGERFGLVLQWANRGTVPLMRAERRGTRDAPASYLLSLALVNPASGATAWQEQLSPSIPTTQWHSGKTVETDLAVLFPETLPSGTYEVRVGLVDPSPTAQAEPIFARLINAGEQNHDGRYAVGLLQVNESLYPTVVSAPTATEVAPSQPGGGTPVGALLGWVREAWAWVVARMERLRYLF